MSVDTQAGKDFVLAMQGLFGQTATQTKEFVENSITGATGALRTEILGEMNLKAGDVKALQNAMTAFYNAVDGADLEGEDGTINLSGTFTSIFAKIGLNESNIATLNTTVTNLESALNTKIADVKKAGEDLAVVVNNLKTTLQGAIDNLIERVTLLENRMTTVETKSQNNKDFIEGAQAQMATATTDVVANTKSVYGLA